MNERLRAYAELLRLSNVLTAVSNVLMGIIVMGQGLGDAAIAAATTAASVALYLGGMALNDVFDATQDKEHRPERPIPSGRIAWRTAASVATTLLGLGVTASAVAAWLVGHAAPLATALLLLLAIVLYDGPAKRSLHAPFLMGVCRGLNVLLGMSVAGFPVSLVESMPALPASAIGTAMSVVVYIMGVTIFARGEAAGGARPRLVMGAAVSLAGLAMLAARPLIRIEDDPLRTIVPQLNWLLLWAVVAMLIGRRFAAAILQPTPKHVQSAVGNALQGIILIDAALAWGYAGPYWGLAILALLPPTMLMARFIPQT